MRNTLIIILLLIGVKQLNVIERTHLMKLNTSKPVKRTIITATMYNAVPSQCDADPYITAGMFRINPKKASEQRYIALSRDLIKRWGGEFNYGAKVLIKGAGHKDGLYIVVDTMNKRFKKRMDFLETVGTKHYKFDGVEITKV